ncbi:MAG: hypothetical protein IT359_02020 [Gemmatimonadaceae bacterium]|nr:hypothetical protein [Gemmatimonadaceae bacterium]
MNALERNVRALVIRTLRDTGLPPTLDDLASANGSSTIDIRAALHSLEAQHRLALRPGTDEIWMAHPFAALPSDFVVASGGRSWWANCVWDGFAILGMVGDGTLDTHSPRSGAGIRLTVERGRVLGDAIVHFLVPARHFWDDIGFT